MAADAAEAFGLPLAETPPATKEKMKAVLPGFATPVNPIDVTGALLTDSGMFERLLPVLAEGVDADLMLAAIPIAGAGYDLPRYVITSYSIHYTKLYDEAQAALAFQGNERTPSVGPTAANSALQGMRRA